MKRLLTLVLLVISLAGCGGSDSNVFAVINGKQVSMPVDGVDIVASGLAGQYGGGLPGVPYAGKSLSILVRFINGNIVDMIRFDIKDVTPVIIGQTIYVDQANIVGTLQLNGVNQYVPPGTSLIKFDELGVAEGQTVSGDFQLNSPTALMTGHFEGSVKLGF